RRTREWLRAADGHRRRRDTGRVGGAASAASAAPARAATAADGRECEHCAAREQADVGCAHASSVCRGAPLLPKLVPGLSARHGGATVSTPDRYLRRPLP